MTRQEFYKNFQNLINDYMEDRKDKKDVERVRKGMELLLDEMWIKLKKKEKSELLEKQMQTLDTMWINICTKRTWKELRTNTVHLIERFEELLFSNNK